MKDAVLFAIALLLAVGIWFLLNPDTFWQRLVSLLLSVGVFVLPWYLNYIKENYEEVK